MAYPPYQPTENAYQIAGRALQQGASVADKMAALIEKRKQNLIQQRRDEIEAQRKEELRRREDEKYRREQEALKRMDEFRKKVSAGKEVRAEGPPTPEGQYPTASEPYSPEEIMQEGLRDRVVDPIKYAQSELGQGLNGQRQPASLEEYEAFKQMTPEEQETFMKLKRGERKPPSDIQSYEYFLNDPGYVDFLKSKRDLPPDKKELDYKQLWLDYEKGQRDERKLKASEEEADRERSSKAASRATVSGFIARDLRFAKQFLEESADNPYVREAKSKVWTTTEYKLQNALDSIRKTIAIDQLLDIKRQGSGLGQVPQQQLEHLADLLGVVNMRLPKDRIRIMLNDIQETYMDVLRRMTPEERAMVGIAEREFKMGSGEGAPTSGGAPTNPKRVFRNGKWVTE